RGERPRLRALDLFFDGERVLPRRLEVRVTRDELAPRAIRIRRPQLDLFGVQLLPPDELEILVRRLVKLEILDLLPVRDVPLRLLRLPLQRAEVSFDLRDDVAHAQEVLLAELHLPLG